MEMKRNWDALEDKGVVSLGEPRSDIRVHRVDVGLVYSHTLLCQTRRIVDGDVVQFRVFLPVLVQDQ